jgi:hypothetical protein
VSTPTGNSRGAYLLWLMRKGAQREQSHHKEML